MTDPLPLPTMGQLDQAMKSHLSGEPKGIEDEWRRRFDAQREEIEQSEVEFFAWLKHQPRWQPIETAPKDGTQVLGWLPESEEHSATMEIVFYGKHNHVPLYGWLYRGDRIGREEVEGCQPTHWMPLPSPPDV
jgi:Protein of unknown function (DUF551)